MNYFRQKIILFAEKFSAQIPANTSLFFVLVLLGSMAYTNEDLFIFTISIFVLAIFPIILHLLVYHYNPTIKKGYTEKKRVKKILCIVKTEIFIICTMLCLLIITNLVTLCLTGLMANETSKSFGFAVIYFGLIAVAFKSIFMLLNLFPTIILFIVKNQNLKECFKAAIRFESQQLAKHFLECFGMLLLFFPIVVLVEITKIKAIVICGISLLCVLIINYIVFDVCEKSQLLKKKQNLFCKIFNIKSDN